MPRRDESPTTPPDEIVEEASETDPGSVFSRTELRDCIGNRLRQHPHRYRLLALAEADGVTNREFLRLLGFAGAGTLSGLAGCSGLSFSEPEGSIPLDVPEDQVYDVVNDGDATPGGDVAPAINEANSDVILIPPGEYEVSETVQLIGDKTLFFDDVTLHPPDKTNPLLFESTGRGWYVGGNLEINQRNCYPRVHLRGSGQFGDEHGRISFQGTTPIELIDDKHDDQHPTGFLRMWGDSDDQIRIMNLDQYEAPPQNECADPNFFWTTYPGTLEIVRCHIGNFNDNGFYVKTMKGRLEIYDSYLINNNVAAVRNGVTGGVRMERCHVRTAGNRNPARTAGRTCAGVNHSMMAFQDTGGHGDGETGDVVLDTVCYSKGENPPAGEFLRAGPGEGGGCTVTIRNCTWPDYPFPGSGGKTVNAVMDGGNNAGPCDADRGPAPFGE